MKVLFLMSHAGHARNFESTLRGLLARGHQVEMGFDRTEKKNLPEFASLAEALQREFPTLTSSACPRPKRDEWSLTATTLRTALDYMRYLGPEFDEAPKLRARAEKFAPGRARRVIPRLPRPARWWLRRTLDRAERWAPISPRVLDFLRHSEPDVVLVTPLLEPGSIQVEYLRAANRLGIPTVYCVASWDNLTNKGVLHEMPDAVTVWNPMQTAEAVRFHAVPENRVHVTGAIAFDHWFGWVPSRTREEFSAAIGLDPNEPFVLYVGSSGFIAPDEAAFVVEWLRGVRSGGLEDFRVLARPHPSNPLMGRLPSQAELQTFPNVTVYPAAGANPTNAELRQDYFDSLYYSSAVAGVNTTAFLEAAILGRPVFTMLADRYHDTQAGTLHFHHLLHAGGGLLHVAESWGEHAAQLRDALARSHPEECVSERSIRFTEAFVRPFGLGEAATPLMLDVIERAAEGKVGRARRRPWRGGITARVARRMIEREQRERAIVDVRDDVPKRKRADADIAVSAEPAPTPAPKRPKAEREAERDARRAAKSRANTADGSKADRSRT